MQTQNYVLQNMFTCIIIGVYCFEFMVLLTRCFQTNLQIAIISPDESKRA